MKKEMNKIEKKLYVITAILLSVSGAIFGLYLAEVMGSRFPEIENTQLIISRILISIIFAGVMFSLSKPLSKLFYIIVEKLQGALISRPSYKNMSFVFGLILGATLTVTGGIFLRKFAKIDPTLQFVILVVSFLILTYASVWMFEKILGSAEGYGESYKGYVIASTALGCDKILLLAPKLVGKIAIMDVTASKLTTELADAQVKGESTEEQERAFNNYLELKKKVNLQFAQGDVMKSELENLVAISKSKKLRIIAYNPLELFDDDEVDVLYLKKLQD